MLAAGSESRPKLFIKAAAISRHVTSPNDVTSTSMSSLTEDTSELGVQLTVGRRLKHIAMKATFDQPRNKDKQFEARAQSNPSEFYASELLGSFIADRQQSQPSATVVQAVEVPLSTLIVVGSPFSHTVHYINADQLHDDSEHGSPSSSPTWSSELASSSSSSSSPDSHSSSSCSSSMQMPMFHSPDVTSDEPYHLDDVMSADSSDDRATADLADLDELRETDLLPLPLCSESPWYLGLTDDELRRLLLDPICSSPAATPAVDVGDLISATELSWPSPNADISRSYQASKCDAHDYSTPEVIELLGSLYDDWIHDDPDIGSFFSST